MDENFKQSQCTCNYAEKIVFVIDTTHEFDNITEDCSFSSKSALNNTLYALKRAIEIFFHNKLTISPNHEFAIIALDTLNAYWLCDFTNDLKKLLTLESIESTVIINDVEYFDLKTVFELINEKLENTLEFQSNIVRVILTYSRSFMIPRFDISETNVQKLLKKNNLFLDMLYVCKSEKIQDNQEEIIYNELAKLNVKNDTFFLKVTDDSGEIHKNIAKLLVHPLQRQFFK